jgi:vacuolar-type H+-ATPase subunit F/Vma7
MSQGVRVVCRADVAGGFALAGLRTVEAETPVEATDRLRELRRQPDVGVIMVEDTLYDRLPEDLSRDFSRRPLPMVVPFPGPIWQARAEGAEAYIVELLRQVVGYRVRLK